MAYGIRKARLLLLLVLAAPVFASSAHAQTVLPLVEKDNLLFTTVAINGHQVKLLLDTGASMTVMRSGVSHAPIFKTVPVDGLGSKNKMPVIGASIALDGESLMMEIGIFDSPGFHGCDGLLGSDFLHFFKRFEVDYKAKTLSLWK